MGAFHALSLLVSLVISSPMPSLAFRDGDSYRITSLADGNSLSINSSSAGYTLTTEPWIEATSQKWLAVEAVLATDAFLLLPHRQTYDWDKFTVAGTKEKRDQLPDGTKVAAYDSSAKELIQETYVASSKSQSQRWRSVSLGHDKFLIKNLIEDGSKCLVNLGELKPHHSSLLEKAKHKLQKIAGKKGGVGKRREPGRLNLLDCNPTDEKHVWRLEIQPSAGQAGKA